jgi:hypothetical protein
MDDKDKRDRKRRIYIAIRLEELKAERERLQEERKLLAAALAPALKKGK